MKRYEWIDEKGVTYWVDESPVGFYQGPYGAKIPERVASEMLRLASWKAEAISVESSWDEQAVAQLIGVPLGHKIRPAIQPAIEALQSERDALAARVKELEEALDTIKGGHTDRFPGAPDATTWTGSPSDFRSAMWTWSQSVAKNALEQSGEGL